MPQLIRFQLHAEPLVTTICKETKWSHSTFYSVHWEAYGKAFQNLPRGKQISYSKLTHGIINTNVQNSRFYKLSDTCPSCGCHQETIAHLLTCQKEATLAHRNEALSTFIARLKTISTPESISSTIQHGLQQWEDHQTDHKELSPSTIGSVQPIDVALTQAFRAQSHDLRAISEGTHQPSLEPCIQDKPQVFKHRPPFVGFIIDSEHPRVYFHYLEIPEWSGTWTYSSRGPP